MSEPFSYIPLTIADSMNSFYLPICRIRRNTALYAFPTERLCRLILCFAENNGVSYVSYRGMYNTIHLLKRPNFF
jgi:hypothetical protein